MAVDSLYSRQPRCPYLCMITIFTNILINILYYGEMVSYANIVIITYAMLKKCLLFEVIEKKGTHLLRMIAGCTQSAGHRQ